MEDVKKIIFMKLPNKQKILFVDKINPFNLIFLIFFRIYFDKIFFLEIVRSLRNKRLLSLFEIIGLNWVNYTYYDLEKVHNNRGRKTIDFEDKYAIYISKKIWINSLSIFFLNKDLFAACIMSKIHTRLHHMYEIIEVAQVFKQKNRVYLMMSNDFFFKTINKDYNFKNINIINYEVFKVFDFIFLAFLKLCLVIFKKITSISFYDKKSYQKYKENKFTVAFFPHKGMFVKNNAKRHFYIKKSNSNFNQQNIAHIEWNSYELSKQSHKLYLKKKTPLFFWNSFKKKSPITLLNFFIFKFKLLFKLYKYSILLETLSSAYQVQNAKHIITNNFPKLKYILAGYDILFPVEVSLACRQLNIKTIAVQDRLLHPVWSPMMCFDYYFTLGSTSNKFIKKRMGSTIKNTIKTQLSTMDPFNTKKNEKYKNNLKCLIVDFSSLKDEYWYSNGRSIIANWKTNYNFYYNVLSCSKKYPNILFLIKSKNYFWIKVNYLKDLIKALNKQKNIKILSDQKKWTPDHSIKYTDFAISRYSSLSDEMFYLNKPILLINDHGYPGGIYNFGNKLLVNNLNQLENKINLIQKNYNVYNKSLDKLRKTLFHQNIKKDSLKNLLTFFDNKLNMQ
tara:strand:- start:1303 stop:3156 length:1854 start_codon:yes stop_codon:yes gene_type:complete